jgi:hypothetical protein
MMSPSSLILNVNYPSLTSKSTTLGWGTGSYEFRPERRLSRSLCFSFALSVSHLPCDGMPPPGRSDPCPCNSGKKYKKCCLSLDEGREGWTAEARSARSLKDKNIALINGMFDIFDLKRPWPLVKDGMSDSQIREFYRYIAALWPVDTNPRDIMPAPDSSLRALYLGENEPELMLENVFRFCLYADQIILVNPFTNPNVMAERFNPIVNPGEWKIHTIRVVFHLMLLAPWIYAGLVVLIPDPGDFDRSLRLSTWNLASTRLKGWKPSDEDLDNSIIREKTRRTFLMAPSGYLRRMVREANLGISNEEVERVVQYMERQRANDPLLPNETLDRLPGQMSSANVGGNLEMGLYICHATGAFPYTNVKFRWKELLSAKTLDENAQTWTPLTRAFQQLNFKFLEKVDSNFACSIRSDGRLEGFRSYLRKLWHTVEGNLDKARSEAVARDFRDELTQAYHEAEADWNAIDRDLLKWAVPKLGGAALVGGAFSPSFAVGGFALAGVSELIQAQLKRREFRKKVPMSVFIDLERK